MHEEKKTAPKRVSDSFRAHEMLSDGDLSEDYDNDPVYFSFDDSVRVQLVTTHHTVEEEAKGAAA